MNTIRRSVFETNSSSSHTITIKGGRDYVVDPLPVQDGVWRVYPGQFGWEIETYYDASTKASYALTYAKQRDSEALLGLLQGVIAAETNAPVEFVESSDKYYPWGYIDHQSNEVCAPAFETAETLRDFIFNQESELHTDNDNHY